MEKRGYTYIMTNKWRTTLYVGVTSDLVRRVYQHREGVGSAFTMTYVLRCLVWFEVYEEILLAIRREKQLKAWKRDWKIALIEKGNPTWRDLYIDIARP